MSPRANPFNTYMQKGYTGHEHLDELGLIHMNGRVYDTLLRRFLSADPVIQAPLDTQSYNRYSYVKNNPLKYTDPSGFSWLSKTLKKVGRFIKNNWRAIAGTALMFIPGGQGFGALLLKGFAANMLLTGGDWKQSALNAFMFAGSGGQMMFTAESGDAGPFDPLGFTIALMRNIRTYGTGPGQTTRPPDENFRTPLLYTGASVPAGGVPAARGAQSNVQQGTAGGTGALNHAHALKAQGRALTEPYVAGFNPSDPRFHQYEIGPTFGCYTGDAGCSKTLVANLVEAESIPFTFLPPSIGRVNILGMDPVWHSRPNDFVSINDTLYGHRYHPGIVVHVTFESQGAIWFYTRGVGTGPNPYENAAMGYGPTFGRMHYNVHRMLNPGMP